MKRRKKIKTVVILKNGSMRTLSGKKATWSQISEDARFIHKR